MTIPCFLVFSTRNNNDVSIREGVALPDKLIWGTYIHSIFDNDNVRNSIIDSVMNMRGKARSAELINYRMEKEKSYNRLADVIGKSCQGLVDLII